MHRVLFFVALLFAVTPASADAPRQVVSFNLCADQLVVALADPEQIAGLSPYAADPDLSVVAARARNFRKLDWQAEATIALRPDLVFTGAWDRAMTRRMLDRLGFHVVSLPLITDLSSVRDEIRQVAALLGHPERGEALLAALERARARLNALARPGTGLVIERGGFAAGSQTLAAILLQEAGLRPPADAPGGYGGFIPLERLLTLRPDYIFVKDPPGAAYDQGALYFTHPALQALYPQQRRIVLPPRYTFCGGPALVEAFDYLADILSRPASP